MTCLLMHLGHLLRPRFLAPSGRLKMAHFDGEISTARGKFPKIYALVHCDYTQRINE